MSYFRGTFHQHYALPKNPHQFHGKTHRLLDCLLSVAQMDDADYLEAPGEKEFAVVDTFTKEKAWFELPDDYTPEAVGVMITSNFNAGALRISTRVWCV